MRRLLLAAFLLAAGLRLALALVNTEANDDHMSAVFMVKESGRLPIRGECHECFQPKLFYASSAVLLKVLDLGPGRAAVRAVQLMNCAAGLATLWLLLLFVESLPAAPTQRLAGFCLAAFNPYLVAIHAQASNDAFAVLFSTAALYHAFVYFRARSGGRLLSFTLFSALASLSKGTGLVLFVGFGLLLTAAAWTASGGAARKAARRHAALFVLGYLLVVPYFGQYVRNYREFGSPFVTNMAKDPLPYFFKETYPARPGMTSIFNSYFSFYFPQLLRVPMISADPGPDQYHKTSFWTLLYGTTHTLHYYQWPKTWRSKARYAFDLARAIFVLALIPTVLFAFGLLQMAAELLESLRRDERAALLSPRAIALLFTLGFGSFLIVYSLFHRDFGSVKAIYIYPGLLAFVVAFGEGYALCASRAHVRAWINGGIGLLCLLYAADVAAVIARLV